MQSDASIEYWQVEIFDEPEQVARFANHVGLRPNQFVNIQFQVLGATTQRILLTCRLTAGQLQARHQWQSVERTLNPPAQAVATGGGH